MWDSVNLRAAKAMVPSFLFVVMSGLALVSATHPTIGKTPEPVHHVQVRLLNETSVIVDFDKPAKVSNDKIDHYEVQIRQMLHEFLGSHSFLVQPPQTHIKVYGLIPKVVYNLQVAVIMKDKGRAQSPNHRFTTDKANATDVCLCDPYGSYNFTQNDTCTPNLEQCSCRPIYTGSHCSICGPKHYRTERRPCERCPCYTNVSNGHCTFDPRLKRTKCTVCLGHHAGPLCELCKDGYYRPDPNGPCVRCRCPRLYDPHRQIRCHVHTGHCLECPNGTTGFSCEQCLPGWSGVSPHCQPGAALIHSSITVVTALVALLCVAAALLLGYWAMRVRARKKRLNAWSLELNRYELEQPIGLVDSASHSGLMMEEAPPPTSSRLQIRQTDIPAPANGSTKSANPLV